MSRIGVEIRQSAKAFLPEFKAIADYLAGDEAFEVMFHATRADSSLVDGDVVLLALGLAPFNVRNSSVVVGRYASTSTGYFRSLKDLVKRYGNRSLDLVLSQNQYVHRRMCDPQQANKFLPMGYFPDLVRDTNATETEYDVIYSGTTRRPGVLNAIVNLADLGFRVAVAGDSSLSLKHKNVVNLGRLSLEQTYDAYAKAVYGLNYVPDVEPYSMQASTKLIEYVASGLKVITNNYSWVRSFALDREAQFLEFSHGITRRTVESFPYVTPAIDDLGWPRLFESIDLRGTLQRLVEKRRT